MARPARFDGVLLNFRDDGVDLLALFALRVEPECRLVRDNPLDERFEPRDFLTLERLLDRFRDADLAEFDLEFLVDLFAEPFDRLALAEDRLSLEDPARTSLEEPTTRPIVMTAMAVQRLVNLAFMAGYLLMRGTRNRTLMPLWKQRSPNL